ncbi:ROK family transcriptional regulator [Streptomyces thermolilacinus]|uniref:Transcriptional regulator n=1 Tax=Streptomyces thermolilacinus SPC6 TaxID=1306406 RepID=A0A1D3E179_9ACTN|nr:ROK family transcriptional regulator [Streptomyces thermolilacinus]OEJ98325.1 transcriptional regulator [Streptomyces thermolilacinus SPC6]
MKNTLEPLEPKADKATVRRHNLSLVLRAVHDEGEATRAGVAARVGLTRAAVSSLVEQLLAGGFLTESGKTFSGLAGRPGTALRVARTGPAGLGVEINVDYVSVCVVDLAGTDRVRLTEHLDNRDVPPGEVLARAARIAARTLVSAAEQELRPAGVRLALPGLVSGGRVRQAPNLGWNRVAAEELFASALRAPGAPPLPVGSDNEANAAALAELWFGGPAAGRDGGEGGGGADGGGHDGTGGGGGERARSFLYVSGEIGVGGAIVVDGELLRGAHGFAGEIGHVPADAAGPECRCGSRGCLEQYAGQAALLRGAGLAQDAGGPGVAELERRAADGDVRALGALERAGRALGLVLSGAVNLLDPDAVVLGGVYRGLMPWLGPAVDAELARRGVSGLWTPGGGRLRGASSSGDAARGAAALVVRDVIADPVGYAERAGGR